MPAMALATLERLATLVRDDDPSIPLTWLPADGRLQTCDASLKEVCTETINHLAQGFRSLRQDEFPMHFCAWGKARVGSTALSNLFGLAGFASYYQPVKCMLRTVFAGLRPMPWILPSAQECPRIFTKETQGPYTLGECLFIPLQILIEAGYPPSKLHLIVLERNPERSLASWLSKLTALQSPELLERYYVISALNANRVRSYAYRHGVPVTHFVYEASKEPLLAARALFNRLGLSRFFSDRAVTNWGERGQLDSLASHRIIYPSQPAIYDLPGLHGSDSGYRYRNSGSSISDEQRHLLEVTGVYQLYRDAVEICIRDLGLDEKTVATLFGREYPTPSAARFATFPPGMSGQMKNPEMHPETASLS
jgi:hypothetical protein